MAMKGFYEGRLECRGLGAWEVGFGGLRRGITTDEGLTTEEK